MATAFYQVRNVVRLSETHVRLEARFEAGDGNGTPGSGTVIVIPGVTDAQGWEVIDIKPFTDAQDARRQLEDITRRKDARFRAAAPQAININPAPVAVTVPDDV